MAIEVGPALGLSADSSDLKTAIPVLDALAKKAVQAEAAADKLAGGTKRMGSAMAAALASLKSIDGSLIKMASSQNKANQETDEAARKAQSAAAGYGSLRASLDPLYAASKRYEAALQTLDAATEAGVISDRDRLNTLRMLDAQFAATNTGAVKMAGGVGAAGNVFAQFNDIGMMAFSGQSPLMLAIQQGTSLNQVWGQLGNSTKAIGEAISGAFTQMLNPLGLLTLGIIAGGAALVQWGMSALGASEETKTFRDLVDELANSVTAMDAVASQYSAQGLQDIVEKYGEINAGVLALIENQRQFAEGQATAAAQEAVTNLANEYGVLEMHLQASGRGAISTNYALGEMADQLGISREQARAMAQAIQDAARAKGFDEQSAALARVNAILAQSAIKGDDLAGAALDAESAMRQLAKSAPASSWMNAALSGVYSLGEAIRARIAEANALRQAANAPGMDTGTPLYNQGYNGIGLPGNSLIPSDKEFKPPGTKGGGGGGGGGGGKSERQTALENLITELATERETIEAWRGEQLALLQKYSDSELDFLGGRNAAKIRLEEEYQERLRGIIDSEKNYRLTETGNMFDALASVAAAGGKKALRAQAVLSAASALISGYEAAMKAAAEAKTIPGRIAAYAQFVGMGLKAAATIRSAGGAGGGGGGGSSATAPATSAAAPARPQDVILDYSATADPAMRALAAALLGPMIDQLQKASKTGINIVAVRA